MARNNYVPGDWFGVVRSGTVVVLGPGTGPELLESLWALLERRPEIHEILNEVTEAFGVSLTRIPAFGIIDAKDALRVVLRGDLDLETYAGVPQNIHGRDVTTWTERRMELPGSYRLRIGAAQSNGADSAAAGSLPLQEGVVLLSGLEATLVPGEEPKVPAAGPVPGAQQQSPEPVAVTSAPGLPTAERPASVETILAFEPEPASEAAPALAPEAASAPEAEAGPAPAGGPVDAEQDEAEQVDAKQLEAVPQESEQDEAEQDEPEQDEAEQDEAEQDDLELTIAPGHLHDGSEATDAPPAVEVGVDTGATTDEIVRNLEQTSSYDHLWERTVIRSIEDAAVRVNPDEEEHAEPTPAVRAPEARPQSPEPAPTQQQPAQQQPAQQQPAPQHQPAPQTGGLISSVPWLSGNSAPAPQPSAPPQQWAPPAAPPPASFAPGAFSDAGDEDSDHDGHTVMKSSLANLPSTPAPAAPTGGELLPDGTKRPLVLARVCPQGHANPPTYAQCASCGSAMSGEGVQVPRPSLGKLRLSTGEVIELDRSLVIGRQPSVSRVQGGGMPALVQVESPGGDISRSHVEVRLEGWHVMLCDLKATNGTVLVREGQAPRRLAQNEMAIVLDGDIAELGDNISLRFEEIL